MITQIVLVRVFVIIGGLAVAIFVLLSYFGLRSADAALIKARADNSMAIDRMSASSTAPVGTQIAAVTDHPQEESTFYNSFRSWCRTEGVRVGRWDTNASTAQVQVAKDSKEPIGKLATVVLEGPYDKIRRVLDRIERSPRLLNISNAEWRRAQSGQTQLTLALVRYVVQDGPQP